MPPHRLQEVFATGFKLWLGFWLVVLLGWGVLGRVGEVALSPGSTVPVDPLVRVIGGHPPTLAVVEETTVARPLSPIGWVLASLDPAESVVPEVSALRPGDAGPLSPLQQAELGALLAAAGVAHLRVTMLAGQVVRSVLTTSPLTGRVEPGDLVAAVDGVPVPTQAAYAAAVAAAVLRAHLTLTVARPEAGSLHLVISTLSAPSVAGQLGLVTTPGVAAVVPARVELRLPDAEASAAGLALALVIADELDPRLFAHAPRVRVAALAGVAPNGTLLAVSGLRQRILAARVAGVQVVLVASSQAPQAAADAAGRVEVLEARTLVGAIRELNRLRVASAARSVR